MTNQLKFKVMKKLFTCILMLIACIHCSSAQTPSTVDKQGIDLDEDYVKTGDYYERSMLMPMVEAYYYPSTGDIELELQYIGEANVYIVDADGNIIDATTTDTDVPTTVFLNSYSCEDYFYVVVYSEVVYAHGVVQL